MSECEKYYSPYTVQDFYKALRYKQDRVSAMADQSPDFNPIYSHVKSTRIQALTL
jgi:hypothetical protein